MTVRALYMPDADRRPDGDGLPRGHGPQAEEARKDIRDFLTGTLLPLPGLPGGHYERVDREMTTMTQIDRTLVEIDMRRRDSAVHGFDYDPLR